MLCWCKIRVVLFRNEMIPGVSSDDRTIQKKTFAAKACEVESQAKAEVAEAERMMEVEKGRLEAELDQKKRDLEAELDQKIRILEAGAAAQKSAM